MPEWISLDGAVNVRDVGGLIGAGERPVRPGRLIRADNLQDLSERDVRLLVDTLGVRAVSDLRTVTEVQSEGPGPMTREGRVLIQHNSLFVEAGINTDAAAAESEDDPEAASLEPVPVDPAATRDETGVPPEAPARPTLLPWQIRDSDHNYASNSAVEVYWRYLQDRPDSIVNTLRLIGQTDGAVIVHCAAGKDRTGVVVALALTAVGVDADPVIEDFARTSDRLDLIFARLAASATYRQDVSDGHREKHRPRAETMRELLRVVDERADGVPGWLKANGWTDADQAALEAALLG